MTNLILWWNCWRKSGAHFNYSWISTGSKPISVSSEMNYSSNLFIQDFQSKFVKWRILDNLIEYYRPIGIDIVAVELALALFLAKARPIIDQFDCISTEENLILLSWVAIGMLFQIYQTINNIIFYLKIENSSKFIAVFAIRCKPLTGILENNWHVFIAQESGMLVPGSLKILFSNIQAH